MYKNFFKRFFDIAISFVGVLGFLVVYILKGKLKKVLLVATGALMNTSMCNQHLTIPSIAHAISLEAIE